MKRIFLWCLIIVFLALSVDSFLFRWNNERSNLNIVNIACFHAFSQAADNIVKDINDMLLDLEEAGITAIAFSEISLRDLVPRGDILLMYYGEFRNHDDYIPFQTSHNSFVIISQNEETTDFLYERFHARYTADEFFHSDNIFITNFEVPLMLLAQGWARNLHLGFDIQAIQAAYDMGFDIILRPDSNPGGADMVWQEYENIIEEFNVRTLIFGRTVPYEMVDIILRHDLIVGVIEAADHVGVIEQPGLDDLLPDIYFQVNRVHTVAFDIWILTAEGIYQRWISGVVDRSLRLMYFVPFNLAETGTEDVVYTLETIARFTNTIEDRGFEITGYTNLLNTGMPSTINRIFLTLSLMTAGVLYISYLLKLRLHISIILLAITYILGIAANLTGDFTQLLAFGTAILYPALSSLMMLLYLQKYKSHGFIKKLLFTLLIILGVNALGMYTLASLFSDIRYNMNIIFFRGVLVAHLTPLLLHAVNYFFVFKDEDNLVETLYKLPMQKPTYLILAAGAFALIFLFLSMTRTGNAPIIGATQLEVYIRRLFEAMFVARPRFRELMIGYPSILILIYLYHKYKNNILLLIIGFGVVMGTVSMVNSFSHVFTSIYISMHRTFAAFVLGSFLAGLLLIFVLIFEKRVMELYNRVKNIGEVI